MVGLDLVEHALDDDILGLLVALRPAELFDVDVGIHDLVERDADEEHVAADVVEIRQGALDDLLDDGQVALGRHPQGSQVRFAGPEIPRRLGQELAPQKPLVIFQGRDGLDDLGLEGGGASRELRELRPVEIDDGRHLVDGRLGVILRRGFQVVLGPLHQPRDELGPGGGGRDPGAAVLEEEAPEAVDQDVVIQEGVVLPGDEVLEFEELHVQEVEEHLVFELVVRGELGFINLGHELLVEPVKSLVELVEVALARVLELVVVFRVALQGPGCRVELEVGVPERVLEFLELGVVGRLGQKGAGAASEDGQHGECNRCFLHSFLLKTISEILTYSSIP